MFLYKSYCYSSLRHAKDALISDQPFPYLVLTDDNNIAGQGNVEFTGFSYGVTDLGIYSQQAITFNYHFQSCEYLEPEFTDAQLLGFDLTAEEGGAIAGLIVTLLLFSWGCRKVIDIFQQNQE